MDEDYSETPKEKNSKSWDDIFDFQGRKVGANYTLLKEFLIKNYEVPKLKVIDNPNEPRQSKYVQICPVCGERKSRLDINDSGVEICVECGSGWDENGNLRYDVRDGMSEREIMGNGWFVEIKNK